MNRKFKDFQQVVALQFTLNGSKMDVNGIVEGWDLRSSKYAVRINTVVVYLPEERLVDYEEFWDKFNKEKV